MKSLLFFLAALLLSAGASVKADDLVVRHVMPEGKQDQRQLYFIDLLELVLERTREEDGPYQLIEHGTRMLQGRAIRSVSEGVIDIVWTMATKDREAELLPVRIPLLKGLLGYRTFIIRKQDQEKFAKIQSLKELQALKAGQGHDWPDVSILEANGIEVIAGTSYEGLFSMLQSGRFDYLPRGAGESWVEVKAHPNKEFVVEDTLLLKYSAPIYFFVNKENKLLADRLERGLRQMIGDGSFEELLRNHPANKEAISSLSQGRRKVFVLKNPLLSTATPLADARLWFSPVGEGTLSE